MKVSEEPADILKKSNLISKKSACKVSSVFTIGKLEMEAVLLEEQAPADSMAWEENFALRQN